MLIKNRDQAIAVGYLAQLQFYHQKHLPSSWHPCPPSDWSRFTNHSWPAPWNSNGSFSLEFHVGCFLCFLLFFHGFKRNMVILCLKFGFPTISSKPTQFPKITSSLGQVFVAVTKRESCIYFQRNLHLCAVSCIYAHIWLWKTWNNLFCMKKSKKLRKVTCKNRKSCKKLQYKIPGNSSKHWIIYILSSLFRKLLEAVKKSCKSCKNLPYSSPLPIKFLSQIPHFNPGSMSRTKFQISSNTVKQKQSLGFILKQVFACHVSILLPMKVPGNIPLFSSRSTSCSSSTWWSSMWLCTSKPLARNFPHLRVKIEMQICKKEFLGFCWLTFSVGFQFALWHTWGLQGFSTTWCLHYKRWISSSNKQCNESIALLSTHWSVHVTCTKMHHRQPASYLSTSWWWRHKSWWHRRVDKGKTHTNCWWSPIGACSEDARSTKEERNGDSKHPCLSPTTMVDSCYMLLHTLVSLFTLLYLLHCAMCMKMWTGKLIETAATSRV